jgi:myo-inositol-1(or 4)-monophosphatase
MNTYSSYKALLTEAIDIVRNAGNVLLKYFNSEQKITFKSLFDMVTEADLASEKAIVDALRKLTPDINILAEESSSADDPAPELLDYLWVVDPLDGTTNFAHGFPHFAISLALLEKGLPVIGIVFDPLKNELFSAVTGCGAHLNTNRIKVSSNDNPEKSLIATGFPYAIRDIDQKNLMEFCTFRLSCQGIRRFGAAALDLAYVAAGRLDGFWEFGLKPWDTAAGILIVREAGGNVTRYDGSDYSVTNSDIIASNANIHTFMQQILTMKMPELPDLPRLI